MLRTFSAFILSLLIGTAAFAQSTAINGTIEGTVEIRDLTPQHAVRLKKAS